MYVLDNQFILFQLIVKLLVMLITGLIIAGLVIDLGGGPNHDRIGFRVGVSSVHRLDND